MVIAILVLVVLNIVQCNSRADVKDAKLDAVAEERIQTAWDAFYDIEKQLEIANDSIEAKDILIVELKNRRPTRTNHYDTIYVGIQFLNSGERAVVLADRRDYLDALRRRRLATPN